MQLDNAQFTHNGHRYCVSVYERMSPILYASVTDPFFQYQFDIESLDESNFDDVLGVEVSVDDEINFEGYSSNNIVSSIVIEEVNIVSKCSIRKYESLDKETRDVVRYHKNIVERFLNKFID